MADAYRTMNSPRGQATLFALAFVGVVILAAILLYKSGNLTAKKMQLQNGADAAAYSASVLEARAMNFCAYTNQAVVANEVAIGQMVGMLSWVNELTVIGENVSTVGEILDATVFLAELGAPLTAIGEVFVDVGEGLTDALKPILAPAIEAISVINEIYSVSQEVYFLSTLALESKAILQTLQDNVPGTPNSDITKRIINLGGDQQYEEGARLSDMGLLALAGHFPSYVNGFTKRYALSPEGSSEEMKQGMGRLAATIREGRDPFSSGDTAQRVPVKDIFTGQYSYRDQQTRDWQFGISIDFPTIHILIASITIGFSLDLESFGGSELINKDNSYVWSAVDTAAIAARAREHFRINYFFGHKSYTLHEEISVPVGGGGFQVNDGEHSLAAWDVSAPSATGDAASPPAYGNARDHLLSWEESKLSVEENQLGGYRGLHPYRDVAPGGDGFDYPFKSPHFLVAVIQPMNDVERHDPQLGGLFDLPELNADRPYESFNDALGALAKSEVYFARPADLKYFHRKDGQEETTNLFSPFWEARLVKTNDFDRFLTLALQHKILWIELPNKDDLPSGHEIIEALKNFLENLV